MAYRTPKPMVRAPPWQAFQGQRPQPGHEEWGAASSCSSLSTIAASGERRWGMQRVPQRSVGGPGS